MATGKHEISKNIGVLRGMQFIGLRDKFLALKGTGAIHQRYGKILYYVPILFFTGLSMAQTIRTGFGVYLKHQALVDSYYQFKLNEKYKTTESDKPIPSMPDKTLTIEEKKVY